MESAARTITVRDVSGADIAQIVWDDRTHTGSLRYLTPALYDMTVALREPEVLAALAKFTELGCSFVDHL